jgi:hypothetical protein
MRHEGAVSGRCCYGVTSNGPTRDTPVPAADTAKVYPLPSWSIRKSSNVAIPAEAADACPPRRSECRRSLHPLSTTWKGERSEHVIAGFMVDSYCAESRLAPEGNREVR